MVTEKRILEPGECHQIQGETPLPELPELPTKKGLDEIGEDFDKFILVLDAIETPYLERWDELRKTGYPNTTDTAAIAAFYSLGVLNPKIEEVAALKLLSACYARLTIDFFLHPRGFEAPRKFNEEFNSIRFAYPRVNDAKSVVYNAPSSNNRLKKVYGLAYYIRTQPYNLLTTARIFGNGAREYWKLPENSWDDPLELKYRREVAELYKKLDNKG